MEPRVSAYNEHHSKNDQPILITVVLPALNEEAGICTIVAELINVLQACAVRFEIIVVDDGSQDDTFVEVQHLNARDSRVKAIRLSRNFGKEAALLAGLRSASGDAVITMDADSQHPPSVIPELLRRWREGAKVVHAVKRKRTNDTWIVKFRASMFNGLMDKLTGLDTRNSSDFKLLDRLAVGTLVNKLPEHQRFYRGLATWIGFPSAQVFFDVRARTGGEAKMSLGRLMSLATTAIVAFTPTPLRIITLLGIITLCFSLAVGVDALLSWWRGDNVSGFVTIIGTLLLIGSAVMISLGIIGEYLAKIYDEVKARPVYLIEATSGLKNLGGAADVGASLARKESAEMQLPRKAHPSK